jgi:hypothetical protein
MRSILASILLSVALAPAPANAEPAVVRTFEAKIYSTMSTNTFVVGVLHEGDSVSVSEESLQGFRRIRLKDGSTGYVQESALTFTNSTTSATVVPAPMAVPTPNSAPGPAPVPPGAVVAYRDVVYLNNGSVVRGVIVEQTPNVSLKIQTADGSVFVYQMAEVTKIGREAVQMTSALGPGRLPGEKSPALAWALSALFPGIGQYYNGDIAKGVAMNILYVGGWVMYGVGLTSYATPTCSYYSCKYNSSGLTVAYVGLGVVTVTWVLSMIDAPLRAAAFNAALREQPRPVGHMFEHDLGGAIVALDVAPNFVGGAVGQLSLHY